MGHLPQCQYLGAAEVDDLPPGVAVGHLTDPCGDLISGHSLETEIEGQRGDREPFGGPHEPADQLVELGGPQDRVRHPARGDALLTGELVPVVGIRDRVDPDDRYVQQVLGILCGFEQVLGLTKICPAEAARVRGSVYHQLGPSRGVGHPGAGTQVPHVGARTRAAGQHAHLVASLAQAGHDVPSEGAGSAGDEDSAHDEGSSARRRAAYAVSPRRGSISTRLTRPLKASTDPSPRMSIPARTLGISRSGPASSMRADTCWTGS